VTDKRSAGAAVAKSRQSRSTQRHSKIISYLKANIRNRNTSKFITLKQTESLRLMCILFPS